MTTSLSLVPIVIGILLIAFGVTLLLSTRDRHAGRGWLIYGLAVPALGCGGLLLISPLITFLGTWLIAFGVVEFCKTQAVC
jgi:uncharacterized membrane protein